jgi:GH25 family lysozyme M1 (1,4-beta-N-acetylmuramidase)
MSFPLLIDVSHHQGEMNWEKAFGAGARAAVIRAGSVPNEVDKPYKDNQFDNNRVRAPECMPIAYYWYFRPNRNANSQAEFFSRLVEKEKFFKLYADVEDHGGLKKDRVADQVLKFIDRLEANFGKVVGIYTRATFWNPFVARRPEWKNYDLWVARYVRAPGPSPWIDRAKDGVIENLRPQDWTDWKIWQYSADGNGRGAEFGAKSGAIDINFFNGDTDGLGAYCGTRVEAFSLPEKPVEVLALSQPKGICQVTASVLNLRSGPSAHFNDMGDLLEGTRVYWYEAVKDSAGNDWLRIGPSTYIAEKHDGRVFAIRQ